MKKMIPCYVLQVAMLVAFIFACMQLMEIKKELLGMKTNPNEIQRLDAPAMRVVVANSPAVRVDDPIKVETDEPLDVRVAP